jgi:hypothetical protein
LTSPTPPRRLTWPTSASSSCNPMPTPSAPEPS